MRPTSVSAPALLATLALACASGSGAPAISGEAAAPARFTGTFQAVQQRTGSALPTSQIRAGGTVELIPTEAGRTRATIQVSTPIQGGGTVFWAVHPGRCGAGTTPIINFETFPLIELSGAGHGSLTATLPVTLYAGRSYHVNVYHGGRGLNSVITCANLRG